MSIDLSNDEGTQIKSLMIGTTKSNNVSPIYNDFMNDVFAPKRH